jgi:hypothetical protein
MGQVQLEGMDHGQMLIRWVITIIAIHLYLSLKKKEEKKEEEFFTVIFCTHLLIFD